MQIHWGVVNVAHIDYAQLIWNDMVLQARQFKKATNSKIPFTRYTKLLISLFMHEDPEIDQRIKDKYHTSNMDQMYSRVRIQKTSTTKQGLRIPDLLLTEAVQNTDAFIVYDEAQRNDSVGLTSSKTKTAVKGVGKGKKVPTSRTKKSSRQPKRKLTIRDEPTDESPVKIVKRQEGSSV